jgi:molybdate transport system substrate-binding protein
MGRTNYWWRRFLFSTVSLFFYTISYAVTPPTVAVASNFYYASMELAELFKLESGQSITIVSGSTGKLFAQIKHGAPYDLFLAADSRRPALLESVVGQKSFAYAYGKLVLWSSNIVLPRKWGSSVLSQSNIHYIAMANADLAPYGRAAKEVLVRSNLFDGNQDKLVFGENISQAFHFVRTGNASIGFVALSQVINYKKGYYLKVPSHLYTPIEQRGILLSDNDVAKSFVTFITSSKSKQMIRGFGYD